jgi:hypothetical protein
MTYKPSGSEGLNDFADQIATAPAESVESDAAVILAVALYRVGAQLVDSFDFIGRQLATLSEELDHLRMDLPEAGTRKSE